MNENFNYTEFLTSPAGHTRLLRRWALRLLRCHFHGLSPDRYPEVHHPPDTLLHPLRGLKGHEELRLRSQENLQGEYAG